MRRLLALFLLAFTVPAQAETPSLAWARWEPSLFDRAAREDKYILLHMAAVLPNIAWGLSLTHAGLREDVTARPLPIERGHARLPDRPGLGIDVDRARIERHRIDAAVRELA